MSIFNSLKFYISPQWKYLNTCQENSIELIHSKTSLSTNDQQYNFDKNIKNTKDLTEIFQDFQTYKNQLYDTHGSIHIQIHSPESKPCYCHHNQLNEIDQYEKNFVEYIYKIEKS